MGKKKQLHSLKKKTPLTLNLFLSNLPIKVVQQGCSNSLASRLLCLETKAKVYFVLNSLASI